MVVPLFSVFTSSACFTEEQVHGTLHIVILDAELLRATFLKGEVCGLLQQCHS